MSYQEYDESIQQGDPIHLYYFERELEDSSTPLIWRYTDAAIEYTALSETWLPIELIGGRVRHSKDFQKASITIQLPATNELAIDLIYQSQTQRTSITVYRGYRSDPDAEFIVYWKGYVTGTKVLKQSLIELGCQNILSLLQQAIANKKTTRNCSHALYQRGCNLNKDNFADPAEITAISGKVLTVTEASLQIDGWYSGGMLKSQDGVFLFIRDHVGDQITLFYEYQGLVESSGQDVILYRGCDRLRSTCINKFNNIFNFRGNPDYPTENPFDGAIV